jgi:hypothetical protein
MLALLASLLLSVAEGRRTIAPNKGSWSPPWELLAAVQQQLKVDPHFRNELEAVLADTAAEGTKSQTHSLLEVEKWNPTMGVAGFSRPVSLHRSPIRTFSETGANPAITMAAVGAAPNVKVGDMIPDISLDSGFPPEKVNLREYAKGKKIVLMGLPGAFTGT